MSAIFEWVTSMTLEKLRIPASAAAYLALAGMVLGTMLAFGWITPVFGGFARASAVTALQSRLTMHWAGETEASLLRMDQARCKLAAGPLRSMYDQLIQRREMEYEQLTGRQYTVPNCGEL